MSEPDQPPLRIRPAARAIVMDPDCRVLLVHFDFPADNLPNGLWACPGGGLDPGEAMDAGLIRELREELGLVVTDPGRPVWVKQHVFPMSRWDGQHDTYFWIRVDAFDPTPTFTKAELRAENLDGMRWWTYEELREAQRIFDSGAIDDPRFVTFTPRRLGHLLDDLLRTGRPDEPLSLPSM